MARVIWSPRAAADLEAICEYIAHDSEYYARLVAERIVAAVEATADFPEAGSIVPEFDDPDVRENFVHRYRIIYRMRHNTVELVTILHGSRQLPHIGDLQ